MKGINFIETLFHKVISGTKTQTRRIIKPQPDFLSENFKFAKQNDGKIILPHYNPGETLYIPEPYRIIYPGENTFEIELQYTGKRYLYYYHVFADTAKIKTWVEKRLEEQKKSVCCNKLFAPQFASKHFIEITGVRAERLQDISDEDCLKEGIILSRAAGSQWYSATENGYIYSKPQLAYAELIDKISGKDTWKNNPFVWVYDFKLVK